MATITDTAICIRRWDYSESSLTISLFARNHGVMRGIAKGAKRSKGAFSGGIDVLTRGQVVAVVKPNVELATITAWHLEHVYRAVRQSLAANRAGLYMADLIHCMVRDSDPHPRLFDAFDAALDQLADESGVGAALLRFQRAVLVETGFQPELDRDVRSGAALPAKARTLAFDPEHGGVTADQDQPGLWRARRETIELLRTLQADTHSETSDPASVERANRLLASYLAYLIGRPPQTLPWAFGEL